MEPGTVKKNGLRCFNCNEVVNLSDKYCPNCGQANHPTKLSIGILFRDFVDNFFDLDSKFFKTIVHIYSPVFLTREYVGGRRVKYANPIRQFFISIVILFGVLTVYLDDIIKFDKLGQVTDRMTRDTTRAELLERFDRYIDSIDTSPGERALADSLRGHLFKGVKPIDSTYLNLSNFIQFDADTEHNFLVKDVLTLEPDSILAKYNITDLKEKIFLKQSLKAYINGGQSLKYLISNLLWVIVLTVLLSAVMLKLLYIRHKIFYIEHIILLCNIHSFFFILVTLCLIAAIFQPWGIMALQILLVVYLFFILIVFKRYYRQGILKTLVKFGIYMTTYNFILFICTIFVLIVSFLLF